MMEIVLWTSKEEKLFMKVKSALRSDAAATQVAPGIYEYRPGEPEDGEHEREVLLIS
jgi:hypothetical protein